MFHLADSLLVRSPQQVKKEGNTTYHLLTKTSHFLREPRKRIDDLRRQGGTRLRELANPPSGDDLHLDTLALQEIHETHFPPYHVQVPARHGQHDQFERGQERVYEIGR